MALTRRWRSIGLGCAVLTLSPTLALPAWAAKPPREQTPTPRWAPKGDAGKALEALWAAKPFELPAATLAAASGGPVPSNDDSENLLVERIARLDAQGRKIERRRSVWRILDETPNHSIAFTWAPWFEEMPTVRARVVAADGTETWLDPKSAVEGGVTSDGLMLSDVKQLTIALPNARRGSVVELETVETEKKPFLEGAGSNERWSLGSDGKVRRWRLSVEVPESMPLKYEVVGAPAPKETTSGGIKRVELETGNIDFNPRPLTLPEYRAKAPRFAWSTAVSWEDVARRYRPLLAPALADTPDLSTLDPLMVGAQTTSAKVQIVLRWIKDKVRYTALHLGDGAIVPTLPSVVVQRGYGDCKDLATLTAVALRKYGVAADVALLMADGPVPSDTLAGLHSFNHMIAVAPLENGQRLWIDATAPNFPVGTLPTADREQKALVISPSTKGLTPTPARADAPGVTRRIYELKLAPFGAGSARVRVEQEGAAEGYWRSVNSACDPTAAHRNAEGSVKNYFGEEPFTAAFQNCKPGEGPFGVTAELPKASALDTGDGEVFVHFPMSPIAMGVSNLLEGPRPGSDDRTEARKADDRKRLMEETGRTEEEFKNSGFSFSYLDKLEAIYRVTLPDRFVVNELPTDRTLSMGPANWSETFKKVDATHVEARFRLQFTKVDWSVAEVAAFRDAYWRRLEEKPPHLSASFEPAKLIKDRQPRQAGALMSRWLAEQPKDGITRARFARQLELLGLGEVARKESERAVTDAPDEALALLVRADIARRDDSGIPFATPFERTEAIKFFRKALLKQPDHSWISLSLADTLRRNQDGDLEFQWTPEVKEATEILRGQVEKGEATDEMSKMLVETYVMTRRGDELKSLLKEHPELARERGMAQTFSTFLMGDVSDTLKRLERISDPGERTGAFSMVWIQLVAMERWEDAAKLVNGYKVSDPAIEAKIKPLRSFQAGLKAIPSSKVSRDTPEAAARSLFALSSTGTTPRELAQRFANVASSTFKPELTPYRPENFTWKGQASDNLMLFNQGRCTTAGNDTLSRVYCEMADHPTLNATSYWAKEGRAFTLVSIGRLDHLAQKAWDASQTQKTREAGLWIDWTLDELRQRGGGFPLLSDYWEQADRKDPASVAFAAALAASADDEAEDVPKGALETIEKGRGGLTGALGRRTAVWLSQAYGKQKNYAAAVQTLRPVAESENEPVMLKQLALFEALSGDEAKGTARIDAALKRTPNDSSWREVKAGLYTQTRRYAEALAIYRQLQREKGNEDSSLLNQILWSQLMLGQLDETSERDAQRLAESSKNSSELHTVATVLLERDLLDPASDVMRRVIQDRPKDLDLRYLFRGRMLQKLGFEDEARLTFAKLSSKEADLVALRKRFQDETSVAAKK